MQGVSSQRDLILAAKKVLPDDVAVIASHSGMRKEVSDVADIFYGDHGQGNELDWIINIIKGNNVVGIHAGINGKRMESYRHEIEALGVKLITGATNKEMFVIADDKMKFASKMLQAGLSPIPSILVKSATELEALINEKALGDVEMCIKPVNGIFGLGFWRFSFDADAYSCFRNPDNRFVNTNVLLDALKQTTSFDDLVLMEFMSGPESSVDMVVDKGNVIVAVSRTKGNSNQVIEMTGDHIELAKRCVKEMGADGLVNVQTKRDSKGNLFLLEANLRPSGGVCHGQSSGVNVAEYFALHLAGCTQMLQDKLDNMTFEPVTVRIDNHAIKLTA